MQVILLKDVERIGKAGEVIRVKDGFAANFLIPRKLAKDLSAGGKKFLEDEKRRSNLREKRGKEKAEALKAKLEGLSCTIRMESGEDEKLFGTVTADMIRTVLAEEGAELDKKQVQLGEHINKLGVYSVDIKLHPEVTAAVKLWVVKK